MRLLLYSSILLVSLFTMAQNAVGIFTNHSDIGNPKMKGDVTYNSDDQSYNLKGGVIIFGLAVMNFIMPIIR